MRAAALHVRRGDRLAGERRSLDAVHRWQIASVLHPGNLGARERLGQAYLAAGAFALAVREYRAVAAAAPRRRHAFCRLALALGGGGLRDAALAAGQEAVSREPRCVLARRTLGSLYLAAGRWPDSVRELRAAARLEPRDYTLHLLLARALLEGSQPGDAESAARDAMRLAPTSADAAALLGRILVLEGSRLRREEAEELLRRAVRANPAHAEARAALGRIHLSRLRLEQARVELEQAVRLEPYDHHALWDLSEVYQGQGDGRAGEVRARSLRLAGEEAQRARWEREVAARPERWETSVCLADFHERRGDRARALEHLDRPEVLHAAPPAIRRRVAALRDRLAASGVGAHAPAGGGSEAPPG